MKQYLIELKGEIRTYTITVRNFNIPGSPGWLRWLSTDS